MDKILFSTRVGMVRELIKKKRIWVVGFRRFRVTGVGFKVWVIKKFNGLLFELGCNQFYLYRLPPFIRVVSRRTSLLLFSSSIYLLNVVSDQLGKINFSSRVSEKGVLPIFRKRVIGKKKIIKKR